ncbi:retron Ec48 family effector membrane protein [Alcanivoracaceae bacterium MT1]
MNTKRKFSMKKYTKITSIEPEKLLNVLFLTLIAMTTLGLAISLWSIIDTIFEADLQKRSLCISSKCIEYFSGKISGSLFIIGLTAKSLTVTATCGGIIVAILGYLNNAQSSALGNHIAHLSIFGDYVKLEIEKLDRLNKSDFDILFLYNFIFVDSKKGLTAASKEYRIFIIELNNQIDQSNKQAKKAATGSFRYKPHQERIIKNLRKIGVSMDFMPRNDFFEAEGQIFTLINTINKSFCSNQDIPIILKRFYI